MSAIKTRFDDRLTQTRWRLRNRDRSGPSAAPPELADLVARLRGDGVVISDFESVFGETALFDEAAAEVQRRYEARPRQDGDAAAGSKGTFLTKLGDPSYDLGQVFARIALHPRALAVVNGYLNLRSTLRALDVWHTHPTAGPAIQTQLWHRDGDDVVNAKMFVYFTDVRAPAGPLHVRARHASVRLTTRTAGARRPGSVERTSNYARSCRRANGCSARGAQARSSSPTPAGITSS